MHTYTHRQTDAHIQKHRNRRRRMMERAGEVNGDMGVVRFEQLGGVAQRMKEEYLKLCYIFFLKHVSISVAEN